MRNAILLITLFLAGCSNPWSSGYQPNPLLGKAAFKPVPATDTRAFQFEKLQNFGRIELAINQATTRAATQPTTKETPFYANQTAQTRLLNTAGLTKDQVTLLGWSEFENWELLNPDEVRLYRFAKHIGADYVLVASSYVNKPKHDIVRPRVIWLNAMSPEKTKPGWFEEKRPSIVWYEIGAEPDKYLYDVLFFRKK